MILLISIVLAVAIAFAVCEAWKKQMKTARIAECAVDYITCGGVKLRVKEDKFLFQTKTKKKIQSSS